MKTTILATLVFTFLFSSCRLNTQAENFVNDLNRTGNTNSIKLIKDPTKQRDMIVVYDSTDGKYYAIELYGNNHFFRSDEVAYDFYMDHRIEVTYNRNGYYQDGRGHLYETTTASPKDLEKAKANLEKIQISAAADKLVNEFGLSDDRAIQVAKMSAHFGKQMNRREMTAEDYDQLGEGLLGFPLSKVEEAAVQSAMGDDAMADELLQQAAETNNISPEHMEEVLHMILK